MPFDYTGSFSGSFTGDLTSTNGVVSSSAQINYTQIQNKPTTISAFQKNSIVANTYFRENTFPSVSASIVDRIVNLENGTDLDQQTLSFNSSTNALTISNGNSVDLSSLAGGGVGGSGLAITASDEGSVLSENVRSIDFVGNAVTATNSGNAITVTINTGSAGVSTWDDLSGKPSGLVSSSTQIESVITDSYISASAVRSGFGGGTSETASYVQGLSDFDGNRTVSNTNLPSGIYNVNFGTSGSLANFIEKVFFPNSVPVITTTGFTIQEFVTSGSVVGTVSATDAEGQSITFRTSSGYTSDFFRISSAGQVTLNTKSTSSMNTDNTPGSGSHPFLIEAVDTFNGVDSKTIYIRVNPNTAPVWRQTSIAGSVISSYTASLNENSTAGAKFTVYFTDAESDTLVVNTGSIPSEFSATVNATNVVISQATASLDYENTTSYSFTMTVEDEHYTSGDDSTTITSLPILIQVVDNVIPVVNDQTLSSINENSSDGTTVGSITATDSEGDTITFSNFTLVSAYLNSVGTNITSSLGGTSLYDPHADPFQANSSGVVTRKTGVYLNSDIADRYVYQVSVRDSYNSTTDTGLITIPISADSATAVTDNFNTLHIIESAVTNNYVKIEGGVPLGLNGSSAYLFSSVSQRWEISSTGDMIKFNATTGSQVYFQANQNISGSIYTSGSTINVEVTASEHAFETTKQYFDYVVYVEKNSAPDLTFTNTTANLNTNGARSGSLLVTIGYSDSLDGDTPDPNTFTFTDPSGQLNAIYTGGGHQVQAKNTLSGSTTYQITASIKDNHGFRTNTETHTFTIAQASTGSLTTNGTFYVIETARSGALIYTNSNGWSGTQGDLNVTYSPSYNSAAVASFTSSNALVNVTTAGALSIAQNVSGSYTSGQTFTSTITFRDQYNNIGSGSITINVSANQAPTAVFTNIGANLTASISENTNLVSFTISDTESDTPYSASLGGSNAGDLVLVPQNANSSSYYIKNVSAIGNGTTLNYSASVFDTHGKSTTYNRSLTISDPVGLVYGYGWNGGSAANESTFFSSAGDVGGDGVAITSGSLIAMLQSGSIGQTTFSPSYVGGTATLFASASLSTMSDSSAAGISTLGYFNFSGGSNRLLIIFPSASNLGGKPASMYDGVPPDSTGTANEYYVYAKDAAIPGTIGTGVYYFDLENSYQGYSKWGMIFAEGKNTNNTRYYLMPDTASAP